MDILEQFLRNISYKFPKGYPDINDAQDMLMLEGILGEMGIDLEEAISKSTSSKAAEDFANSAIGKKYEFRKFKSGKYRNRINSTKVQYPELKDLLATYFGVEPDKVIPISAGQGPAAKDSVSGYQLDTPKYGEIYIAFSGGKKGRGGKEEEERLINGINEYTGDGIEPITVKFIGKNGPYEVENVKKAEDASTRPAGGIKADVILTDGSSNLANISVKADYTGEGKESTGFRWASVNNDQTPFRKEFVKAALTDNSFPIELRRRGGNTDTERSPKYLMFKRGTDEKISKVVVDNAPDEYNNFYIFGNDKPKTVVIGGKFSPDDFSYDDSTSTLTIKVKTIYTDLEQIEGTVIEPKFTIELHKDQPYGLDFRSVPAGKAKFGSKSAAIRIDYSDVL
jgi:hypothetical protein